MILFFVDMLIRKVFSCLVYWNDESCEVGIEVKCINFYRSIWKEWFLSKEIFDLVNFVSNYFICVKEN